MEEKVRPPQMEVRARTLSLRSVLYGGNWDSGAPLAERLRAPPAKSWAGDHEAILQPPPARRRTIRRAALGGQGLKFLDWPLWDAP